MPKANTKLLEIAQRRLKCCKRGEIFAKSGHTVDADSGLQGRVAKGCPVLYIKKKNLF